MEKSLTVTINVNGAGVTLSIIVGVSLVSVSLENTVVTAVANIIPVCVILGRVVQSWTVVLDKTHHKIRNSLLVCYRPNALTQKTRLCCGVSQ